jgi:inositol-pentakisphosphate 2-kinase
MNTTAAAQITETSPEDWNYVSEGGATIVFSYTGPPHSQFTGTVLRLKKTTTIRTDSESGDSERMISFQRNVVERLLPPEHLPRLETVELDKSWLEALAALCDGKRPQERRRKGQIDVSVRSSILATDLVGSSTLSVEIKVLLPEISVLHLVVT